MLNWRTHRARFFGMVLSIVDTRSRALAIRLWYLNVKKQERF